MTIQQFGNVVGALKYGYRGRPETADHYMACACDKLLRPRLRYSDGNVRVLLSELSQIEETDKRLIRKLREALGVRRESPTDSWVV